jgi:ferredoxin
MRVIVTLPDGAERRVEAEVGTTVLALSNRHGFGLEGACGGQMACSTCHVIVNPADAGRLPPLSVEERALLALAPGAGPTSRLGCQIVLDESLEGLRLRIPPEAVDLWGG